MILNLGRLEGQELLITNVLDRGICIRCGACVGLCPYFDYFDGKVVVLDRCQAETWRCLQVCPRADHEGASPGIRVQDRSPGDKIGSYQNIFMARAMDENVRRKAQYGGVASTLIMYALNKGDILSAVLTDSGGSVSPNGKLVKKSAEVLDCSGSRYTAAGALSVLNRAIKAGEGNIGVVGLPCQMEALRRLRFMKPDGEERYARVSLKIGLFCTWALDYRQFNTFLQRIDIEGQRRKYDIPPPPAEKFIIQSEKSVQEFPLSDIRPLVQKGCALCQDMTAEWADISIGAAEGFEEWNTVLMRTDVGADLIRNAVQEGWLETKELPERNIKHLKEASRFKWQRGEKARIDLDRGQL
ncbi:MAG: Coenzyme F420 hydrogenase/dehydrogenase, beta subunit C-terminal domain [Pseudomonadota bacterium]